MCSQLMQDNSRLRNRYLIQLPENFSHCRTTAVLLCNGLSPKGHQIVETSLRQHEKHLHLELSLDTEKRHPRAEELAARSAFKAVQINVSTHH